MRLDELAEIIGLVCLSGSVGGLLVHVLGPPAAPKVRPFCQTRNNDAYKNESMCKDLAVRGCETGFCANHCAKHCHCGAGDAIA